LVAIATSFIGAPSALAEPLTPLAPNEIAYLDQARKVFALSHDPVAFRGDGELLLAGQFVCDKQRTGSVGVEANLISPILNQLALIYLCPS
jgi:hypothetical protein